MLTTLTTLKLRLGIPDADITKDTLLTLAIRAVSARFDAECNRALARATDFAQEFPAESAEILARCYPIETVSGLDSLDHETGIWQPATEIGRRVRSGCVISLESAPGAPGQTARVIYTGGYVLPGGEAGPGQTPLPADLEQAAIEEAACWFLNQDKAGLVRQWLHQGTYVQLAQQSLLPATVAVLRRYQRCAW